MVVTRAGATSYLAPLSPNLTDPWRGVDSLENLSTFAVGNGDVCDVPYSPLEVFDNLRQPRQRVRLSY